MQKIGFLITRLICFLYHNKITCRYLKEMESHPDEWFRYKLEQYLTKAVMNLSEFLHTGPFDTFFLQNATKGTSTLFVLSHLHFFF